MKHVILAGLATLSLAACTLTPNGGAQLSTSAPVSADKLRTYVAEGQLLCSAGPGIVAMFSNSGAALLAKGATKAAVDTACGLINGVAVSPQGAPTGAVLVTLPSTLAIPLKS